MWSLIYIDTKICSVWNFVYDLTDSYFHVQMTLCVCCCEVRFTFLRFWDKCLILGQTYVFYSGTIHSHRVTILMDFVSSVYETRMNLNFKNNRISIIFLKEISKNAVDKKIEIVAGFVVVFLRATYIYLSYIHEEVE